MKMKAASRGRKMSQRNADAYNWLVGHICKMEGQRSQVKRADVREILGILADLIDNPTTKYDFQGLQFEEMLTELWALRAMRKAKGE